MADTKITLENLLQEVVNANTSYLRLNDIRVTLNKVLRFGTKPFKTPDGKEESSPCLEDDKHNQYTGSVNQMAAMRIAKGKVTAVWHDEFLADPNATTFKEVAMALIEAKVDVKTIRLQAVHHLKMVNKFSAKVDEAIYKDFCYEGYSDFYKKRFEMMIGKDLSYRRTQEYRTKMYDLGNTLHATPLQKGRDIEANIELIPVFEIIA
jgi:hypothetical protein